MCGRYSLSQSSEVAEFFEISETYLPPRYNIAPTQEAPVVRLNRVGTRELSLMRWGLVPYWSKEPTGGSPLINARAESAHLKPAFRKPFRSRRCLVPADSFFEWDKRTGKKLPILFRFRTGGLFAFAGLWDCFRRGNVNIESFAILTCEPNSLVAQIHNRMPVILPPEAYNMWLDPETEPSAGLSLLGPVPAEEMLCYPVDPRVNSPAYDSPDCVARQEPPTTLF